MNIDHTSDWLPSAAALRAMKTLAPTRRQCLRQLGCLCAAVMATGCLAPDRYAAKWEDIAIGDSRTSVLAAMGPPTRASAVALPLLSAEDAVWEVPMGRRYTAYFALGRVVAKATAER